MVWTKDDIKDLLRRNDKAVVRGLMAIYDLQTIDEQTSGSTYSKNGVGFNGLDAPILSSFVDFYRQHNYLSNKQLEIARRKMIKYAGQLVKIANNNN